MKLQLRELSTDRRATLIDADDPLRMVTVETFEGTDAETWAKEIARRVNFYEPMVEVLSVFAPDEMGNLLVEAVGAMDPDNPKAKEVTRRLRYLINAVGVILKGIELAKEDGAPK